MHEHVPVSTINATLTATNIHAPLELRNLAIRPQRAYEFPDGFHANFTTERFRITEALFNPVDFLATTSSADADGEKPPLVGIQQMILDAVNAVDVDVKPLLLNNIVLTGGTTLLPTFADRLNNELLNAIPGVCRDIRCCVFA